MSLSMNAGPVAGGAGAAGPADAPGLVKRRF